MQGLAIHTQHLEGKKWDHSVYIARSYLSKTIYSLKKKNSELDLGPNEN